MKHGVMTVKPENKVMDVGPGDQWNTSVTVEKQPIKNGEQRVYLGRVLSKEGQGQQQFLRRSKHYRFKKQVKLNYHGGKT